MSQERRRVMKNRNKTIGSGTALALCLCFCMAQLAAAQVSKEEVRSISTPDKVRTSIGELVHRPAHVWSARALDQEDLAPE